MTLALRYAARSDRGLVRANNEDSVYAGARLLALADGMGGHAAGEVASQLVIAALAHLDDDEPGGDLLNALNAAVYEGNAAIAAHVEADPELDGMGTTLTAILFAGNKLGLVHIGDSRGYLLRDGELTQITKDDTFVQTLVDEGRITAEEAHSHPQRSLIMRALTGHDVEPTLIVREARVGDRYLLCSDGLSDPVSQETILDALQLPDVAESADRLIEMALRGGGPDNVTVVVADVVDYGIGQTQPIIAGAVSGDDVQSAPPNTAAGRAAAFNPRRAEPTKRPATEPDPPQRKPRSKRKILTIATLIVLLLVIGLVVAFLSIRSFFFVTARDGSLYVMRGIPTSVLGVELNRPYRLVCIDGGTGSKFVGVDDPRDGCDVLTLDDLNETGRNAVNEGLPTGTEDGAMEQVRRLVNDSLLPICAPPPPPTKKRPTPPPPPPPPPTTSTTGTSESAAPPPSSPSDEAPPAPPPPAPPRDSGEPSAPSTVPTTPVPAPPASTTSAPPSPTGTALTPRPQELGVDCRAAS